MDMKSFLKIQCGLFVASVGTPDRWNGCITNTLMQQSHAPVKLTITLMKTNLTHQMVEEKRSLGVSALSEQSSTDLIKRFGFQSGRKVDKFADFDTYRLDGNGNPILTGSAVVAGFSLSVYDTVDFGSHTMFLCTVDDAETMDGTPITYWQYRESMKK